VYKGGLARVGLGVVLLAVLSLASCYIPRPTEEDRLPAGWISSVAPTVRDGSYGDGPAHRFDLYLPTSPREGGAPLIIWVHGGGWSTGDRSDLSQVVQHQLDRGIAVASIDYRLVQQGGQFPAPIEDTKLAVRYFRANADRWNLRADRIFLAGASAGGYIASFAALSGPGAYEPTSVPARLEGVDSSVVGVINQVTPVSFETFGREGNVLGFDAGKMTTDFLGCPAPSVDSCDPAELDASMVAPLVKATSPPIYGIYGDADPLVPPDAGHEIDAAYAAVGRPYDAYVEVVPGATHMQTIDYGVNISSLDAWIDSLAQ
jgi:acetyl esterase/lipase